jgi:hypothetical protein
VCLRERERGDDDVIATVATKGRHSKPEERNLLLEHGAERELREQRADPLVQRLRTHTERVCRRSAPGDARTAMARAGTAAGARTWLPYLRMTSSKNPYARPTTCAQSSVGRRPGAGRENNQKRTATPQRCSSASPWGRDLVLVVAAVEQHEVGVRDLERQQHREHLHAVLAWRARRDSMRLRVSEQRR